MVLGRLPGLGRRGGGAAIEPPALHVAARRASGEHVRALIDAGADASVRDGGGRSARDLWWHRGHGHSGRTPTEDFHRIRELLRVAEPG
ncbi:MAG: ankyrin repeat domain-containing protein [Phycisphaeraceae bacterium]|nr:ankyrin repeat domain-containing protein [Phycisphaeraceae bacterium]